MELAALLFWICMAALANYKAAHMISQDGDDGPFDIFKTVRNLFPITTWYGKGLRCFSCTSFWGALIATLLIWPAVPWNRFIIIWAAISTLSFMIWRYFG